MQIKCILFLSPGAAFVVNNVVVGLSDALMVFPVIRLLGSIDPVLALGDDFDSMVQNFLTSTGYR